MKAGAFRRNLEMGSFTMAHSFFGPLRIANRKRPFGDKFYDLHLAR
jgi:hypothetical protein